MSEPTRNPAAASGYESGTWRDLPDAARLHVVERQVEQLADQLTGEMQLRRQSEEVAVVMARDLAILAAAGYGESDGLRRYREAHRV